MAAGQKATQEAPGLSWKECFRPHEDRAFSRALRRPKRRKRVCVLGSQELPQGLRFQDLAVKGKFGLNLAECQTQGHPALTNQSKSLLSNCTAHITSAVLQQLDAGAQQDRTGLCWLTLILRDSGGVTI